MQKRAMPWWTWMIWCAMAAALASLAASWWDVIAWLMAFENLAGWAQAVGAIIAIWSGFYLAENQRQRAAESERLEARAKKLLAHQALMNAAALGLGSINAAITAFDEAVGDTGVVGVMMMKTKVEAALAMFSHIDYNQIIEISILDDAISFEMIVRSAVDHLGLIVDPKDGLPNNSENRIARVAATHSNLRELSKSAMELGQRLNRNVAQAIGVPIPSE